MRAVEALYREHGVDLEAFLVGVLRDRHQASEVVQVVFRKALEHLSSLETGDDKKEDGSSRPSLALGTARKGHPAEELTADELIAKWHSPRGWLFRVAWNEAMLVRRVQTRQQKLLRKAVWHRDVTRPPAETPGAGLVQDETVAAVRKAIGELPEEQQTVVRSRIYEEKTFAVIAEELGLPLGTVLTRMRLAMQKLERSLSRHRE